MSLIDPVIFVPGVIATNLRDLYTVPPDTVWSLLAQNYDRIALHPEDLRYEAQLPAQVRPDQVYEIAYKELILDLRHDLSPQADKPTPVYIFGYDWRQPLEATQLKLRQFIDEVIEKTALTKHYHADKYAARRKVNLVGHSMGGLVITGYLTDAVAQKFDARVHRVATLATPFRGSFNAVEKLIKGTSNRREREAARLTPSLYYLLPSFKTGIKIDPALPQTDLFDPSLWQDSLLESLKEAIRLYGSGATTPSLANAKAILDKLLGQAAAHRKKIEAFKPDDVGIAPADWLAVIGVGDQTRVGLNISPSPRGPVFDLLSPDLVAGDKSSPPTWRTGDGTVPWEGAQSGFATQRMIVSHADFRLLELKEKLLDDVTALHGILPNMDKMQSKLVNHLAAP